MDPLRLAGIVLIIITLLVWFLNRPPAGIQESLRDHQRLEWSKGWDGGTFWPSKSNPKPRSPRDG